MAANAEKVALIVNAPILAGQVSVIFRANAAKIARNAAEDFSLVD
jgi:hypothetical protein